MDFVLLHGAFHGGWCWRYLRPLIEAAGHRVIAPTLTGLGERAHLARPEVGLATHVEDILALYRFEELDNTVMVAHSYGGLVAGCVANRIPERIGTLIYLDAIVPQNGVSLADLQDPTRLEAWRAAAEGFDGHLLPPPPVAFYGVTDAAQQAWAERHVTPQPWASVFDKAVISSRAGEVAKTVYIACRHHPPELAYFDQFVDLARASPGWDLHELDSVHDCMVTDPDKLAAILLPYAERAP
ncbi:MAG: alpha/beta fold hydrolase [Pseudomonadota bacterium]